MSIQTRWARAELAPWRGRGLTRSTIETLISAAAGHGGLFRYEISKTAVTCSQKSGEFLGAGIPDAVIADVLARAESYRALLEQCLPLLYIEQSFSIAIDVSDIAPDISGLPLFCFQKLIGSSSILLPDIDLIRLDYLEDENWVDETAFEQKIDKAVFVGSTTGDYITQDAVRDLSIPRLRAAAAFKTSDHIDFFLPNIVQCDSEETKSLVKAMGVGGRIMDWKEQLSYRHLISIDGNGATCSRMAIALNSNSVVIKYQSARQLFYFRGLQAGLHYISVRDDDDIKSIFSSAANDVKKYKRIALSGQIYARRYLRRAACINYVVELLKQYVQELNTSEGRKSSNMRADMHYAVAAIRSPLGRLYRALGGRRRFGKSTTLAASPSAVS